MEAYKRDTYPFYIDNMKIHFYERFYLNVKKHVTDAFS